MNLMLKIVKLWITLEQYASGTNKKLQACSVGPFKMPQRVDPNINVIDLPLDFSIIFTFSIEDPIVYKKPHHISYYLFEMPPYPTLDDLIELTLSQLKT